MKCSVYIATSVDGFIARQDGNVEWLHTTGNLDADMGEQASMGMDDYLSTVDCMIMGRKCMEVISGMDLTPDQWPYGNRKIIVLSNSVKVPPDNMKEKVEMYSGDLNELILSLESKGYQHAYIDGGTTIQAFINLELINEITITKVPILLGSGIPLFGKTLKDVKLEQAKAIAFPNDFVQVKYTIKY